MRGKLWLALLAVIGFPLGMAALTNVFEKRYTAGMRILVDTTVRGYDQGGSVFAGIDDILAFSRPRSTETHINIMTGTQVLTKAIERTAQEYPKAFSGAQINDQYESLVRRLAVDSSQFNDVLTIRVTMDDPKVAASVANNIGFAYIDFMRVMENEAGNAGLEVVKKQLDEGKKKLDETDQKIAQVKNQAKIADATLAGQSTTTFLTNLEQRYTEVLSALEGSRAELSSAERSLNSMPKMLDASTTETYSPMLQDIEVNLARAEAELKGLLARYLDDHPLVIDIKNRIAEYKRQKSQVKKNISAQSVQSYSTAYLNQESVVANVRGRVASLEQQLTQTSAALEAAKTKLEGFPEVERQLANLLRERQVLESTFLQLDQRRGAIEATGSGRRSVARIVSSALPPSVPSFPDQRLFTLVGLALGLIVGALIIMPRGDQDIYGQWNQRQDKSLRARRTATAKPVEEEVRPAIQESSEDEPYA